MGPLHVIFKMHQVVENQPLPFSLAHRMTANHPLTCWYLAQMNFFNMVYYV